MDEKNLKIIRYLAGVMFVVAFIMILLQITGSGYYYDSVQQLVFRYTWNTSKFALIIELLAVLALAVSMFAGAYKLLPIGAGIYCLSCIVNTIHELVSGGFNLFVLLSDLLALAAYVFFALSVSRGDASIRYGLVSILILCISRLAFYCFLSFYFGGPKFFDFVSGSLCSTMLASASIFLSSIILQNIPQDYLSKTMKPSVRQTKSDRIEELTKLKDLLDVGAITQEEFDAKKKQILEG